ncbi:MAG: metalloregulator ArsR/SmtB family transcription factor [Solirubrobacteraceae bacterium]|nr:metalloregulator ArsR/SmtB family transcription factor [Solirubrobacteraceae bacterium]
MSTQDATDQAAGAVFSALADPTRRHLVRLLRERPTVTASALTDELDMTRQAIAKHLAGLADAGLVHGERRGRETHYALTPAPMSDAMVWMAEAGGRWDQRLDRLEREAGALRGT